MKPVRVATRTYNRLESTTKEQEVEKKTIWRAISAVSLVLGLLAIYLMETTPITGDDGVVGFAHDITNILIWAWVALSIAAKLTILVWYPKRMQFLSKIATLFWSGLFVWSLVVLAISGPSHVTGPVWLLLLTGFWYMGWFFVDLIAIGIPVQEKETQSA